MNRKIHNNSVDFDGDFAERVVIKPFANKEKRIPFIKLDDVYVYFPKAGEIIISKEDINAF